MTKNVDPDEAWAIDFLNDVYSGDTYEESKKSLMAKLHEADQAKAGLSATVSAGDVVGELERELASLPGHITLTNEWAAGGWRIIFKPEGAMYSGKGAIVIAKKSPLAAVRALRKRLEEEGIC